jgi:hypothetical protein
LNIAAAYADRARGDRVGAITRAIADRILVNQLARAIS